MIVTIIMAGEYKRIVFSIKITMIMTFIIRMV